MGQAEAPGTIIPAVLRRVGLADAYFTIETPLGRVYVAYNRQGVAAVMPARSAATFERTFQARFGRPVTAETEPPAALVRAGHAENMDDAFRRFLGRGGVAFIPRPAFHPREAISLIHAAGGLSVLAPNRRKDLARFGFRAMCAGSLVAWLNGALAGLLM